MALSAAVSLIAGFTRTTRAAVAVYPIARVYTPLFFGAAVTMLYRATRQDVYNILGAVLSGFATRKVPALAPRPPGPTGAGLTLGELMAVMVVLMWSSCWDGKC